MFGLGQKLFDWQGMHRRNADANLVDIHEEMSELLDKQVYLQIETLKIEVLGFSQTTNKCVMKNKMIPIIKFLMKRITL